MGIQSYAPKVFGVDDPAPASKKSTTFTFGDSNATPMTTNAESVEPEIPKKEEETEMLSYTFSANSYQVMYLYCYMIENYMKRIAHDYIGSGNTIRTIEVDVGVKKQVNAFQSYTFCKDEKLYVITWDERNMSVDISSEHNIRWLVEELKYEIYNNNPLRKKLLYISATGNGNLIWSMKHPPDTTFKELVCDPQTKDELYDNTIFHLNHMNCNNGIILHGPPGTGKSYACQAMISEAIKQEFSTCFVTTYIPFGQLQFLMEHLLGPTLAILEDVDSYCISRELTNNAALADFLQFMSGVSESNNRMVVVATTNYLDRLDSAVGNRPMRFNAKYKFDYPNPEEISWLIDRYFGEGTISDEQKALCCHKKFSGSHIRLIKEKSESLRKKYEIKGEPTDDVFRDALKFILQQFPPPNSKNTVGFNASPTD